jgi:hypothetical protein
MKFTIRDLLWLTVGIALAAGWLVSVRHRARQYNARENRLLDRVEAAEAEVMQLNEHRDGAQQVLDDAGIEWPPRD